MSLKGISQKPKNPQLCFIASPQNSLESLPPGTSIPRRKVRHACLCESHQLKQKDGVISLCKTSAFFFPQYSTVLSRAGKQAGVSWMKKVAFLMRARDTDESEKNNRCCDEQTRLAVLRAVKI